MQQVVDTLLAVSFLESRASNSFCRRLKVQSIQGFFLFLHVFTLTQQPVAARRCVSVSQLFQGQTWGQWTTAATSLWRPADEIHLFHSPTLALWLSSSQYIQPLWFLSHSSLLLFPDYASSPAQSSQDTRLLWLLLFSCDCLCFTANQLQGGGLQINMGIGTTAIMEEERNARSMQITWLARPNHSSILWIFLLSFSQATTLQSFLLVQGAALAACHRPVANCNVQPCLAKLSPKSVRSQADTCCPLTEAFSAVLWSSCHPFLIKQPSLQLHTHLFSSS